MILKIWRNFLPKLANVVEFGLKKRFLAQKCVVTKNDIKFVRKNITVNSRHLHFSCKEISVYAHHFFHRSGGPPPPNLFTSSKYLLTYFKSQLPKSWPLIIFAYRIFHLSFYQKGRKGKNVKINKMSGKKKGGFIFCPFIFCLLGGLLVEAKKKDIIKEKGETQLLGSFRFTNGG